MPYTTEDPVVTPGDGLHVDTTTTHPAYAQISASRVSGGAVLYGSDFQHQHYMTIRIRRSKEIRNLSNTWHHDSGELIEVALSEAQWATMISSPNVGGGVPCTLHYYNGEMIPQLPLPKSQKHTFKKEAAQAAQKGLDRVGELKAMIAAMKISQKAKDELSSQAESIGMAFTSSMPFILKQFDEHMEATVEKAKIEVNAYATRVVMQTGLHALKNGDAAPVLTYDIKD